MVPSADLGWHRDMPQFGEVSGISLLTACRMRLGIAEAGLFGFSLGGLVAHAVAPYAPTRVGKLIVALTDAHHPAGPGEHATRR